MLPLLMRSSMNLDRKFLGECRVPTISPLVSYCEVLEGFPASLCSVCQKIRDITLLGHIWSSNQSIYSFIFDPLIKHVQ